jgi:peptidyl-prolyl cis-trans isomerase D
LIDRAVLIKEAKAMGLRVSDEELAAHILAVPAFQRNGQFDRAQYERVLAQLRMTPEMFEAAQHDDLLIGKLSDLIARTAKVAEGEAIDWHRWQNATVNLDYVVFTPDQGAIIPPDDDEIRAFYDENKSRYQTPPKRSARYLVFPTADYRSQVRLMDDEVALYYDEHIDEFKTPETIDARHILFKVAQDADDATAEAARTKAEDVHRQIMAGGDFEELARTHSEEAATGANGGFLGTFGRGQMVKPFEEAAFGLEAGQVSAPVRTQFGYHIIRVDKKTPAGTRTLAEAENKIRGQLADRRARALALEDAEAAYDLSYENEDLAAVAEQLGRPLQTTAMLARSDDIEGVADKATFGRILFELNAEGISEVQEIDGDFFIIQVQAIDPSQVPELETVKTRVVEDWNQELRREQAEDEAQAFLQALKDGGAIETLSQEKALELKQTGFFKRNEAIADIGYQPEISAAAFALSKEKPLPENPVRSDDEFYVFRFRERQQPEGNVDEAQLAQTRKQLLQRKQRQLFDDWTAEARARADIQVDRSVLE